jgi:hypothetical protein
MVKEKTRRSALAKIAADAAREKAICALMGNPSVASAAAACGLGESTLRRWLKQPAFVAAYRAARQAALEQVIGGWMSLGADALAALKRGLSCGNPNVEVRAAAEVRAAIFAGEETLRLIGELTELREKVNALTEAQKREETFK